MATSLEAYAADMTSAADMAALDKRKCGAQADNAATSKAQRRRRGAEVAMHPAKNKQFTLAGCAPVRTSYRVSTRYFWAVAGEGRW